MIVERQPQTSVRQRSRMPYILKLLLREGPQSDQPHFLAQNFPFSSTISDSHMREIVHTPDMSNPCEFYPPWSAISLVAWMERA